MTADVPRTQLAGLKELKPDLITLCEFPKANGERDMVWADIAATVERFAKENVRPWSGRH
jgi:hypothetical protein